MVSSIASLEEGISAAGVRKSLFKKADGLLSKDTFMSLLKDEPAAKDDAVKQADKLMARLDTDGDGTVSKDELVVAKIQQGSQDGDNDGLIDADEDSAAIQRVVNKLDIDHDGAVSTDEWAAGTQSGVSANNTSTDLSVGKLDSRMLAYLLNSENQQAA